MTINYHIIIYLQQLPKLIQIFNNSNFNTKSISSYIQLNHSKIIIITVIIIDFIELKYLPLQIHYHMKIHR